MISLQASVCIDAPVERVWQVLSDLEAISLWVPVIRHASCPARRRGVGAERICELPQATIRETITGWEEGRWFSYEGTGAPMVASATNRWEVVAHGTQTLVTSTAEVVLKGGLAGRALEPLARFAAARAGASSLKSLKYFVENGRPYDGRARDLPAVASVC